MSRFFQSVGMVCLAYLLTAMTVVAQPRSKEERDAIANSVLSGIATRSVGSLTMGAVPLQTKVGGDGEAFYVYTPVSGADKGFVIVSGDKRMPAVLGYSDANSFDADNLPDGLRWFLEKCRTDMALIASGAATTTTALQTRATAIAPLLGGRMWDQGRPFNDLCPLTVDGYRTVTGCGATAMAQIMALHRHPVKGTGRISYTTPSYGYAVNADLDNAAPYDWENMTDSYEGQYSDAQAAAVAQLMYHVGAAMVTDFSEIFSGSDTYLPESVLIDHFGYDDGIRIVRRSDCSEETWCRVLQQEIAEGRPVLMSGFDTDGYGGHAFVFDGMDAEGNFHVNWGWSGLCDGYYNFYRLVPDDTGIGGGFGDYSYYNQAFVGIRPEDGVTETEPTNIAATSIAAAEGTGTFSLSTSIKLNVKELINLRHLDFNGPVQLMLTDAEGISTVAMPGTAVPINRLPQGYYISSDISLKGKLPADLAEGKYRLYVGVKQRGYEQWGRITAPITDLPGGYDYYELTVADGEYTLSTTADEGGEDDDEEGSSAIGEITFGTPADNRYYDLQGRPLDGRPTAKGIYICNGRKVVVGYE